MKLIKLVLALLLLCSIQKADAVHVSGGDMEWEYLGNDSFLVTVNVYRNCNGKTLGNQPILVNSSCGSKNYTTTLVAAGDITPVCDEQCTRCDSKGCTFKFGIQKWSLSAIISVADFKKNGCCWVTAEWDECCRDNQFTTGAASTTFYIASKFNVCEATPLKVAWQDNPISVICLGRDFINSSNQLLSSTPSDSVVHSFTESFQSATTKTPWSSPYAYNTPINFLGFPNTTLKHPRGLHLDSTKGTLKFRPMKEEISLITIKASVYRSGRLLGETVREHSVSVIKCPDNSLPIISGMNCLSNNDLDFSKALCVGEKIAFKVCVSDKDLKDTVTVKYSHNMPGAKVSILNKGTQRESLSFEWVADSIDSSQHTYFLYVEANDNACPVNGRTSRTFQFNVSKGDPISISSIEKKCGTQLLIAKGGSFTTFEWTLDSTTIVNSKKSLSSSDSLYYRFDKPGTKTIQAKAYRNGSCAHLSKQSILVKNNFMWLEQTTSDTVRPCARANFTLGLKAFGTTSTPTINWNGVDSSKTFTSKKTFTASNTNQWIHYSADDGGCRVKDSILVQTELNYIKLPEHQLGCLGLDSFKLSPFQHPLHTLDSITSFSWKPSNSVDSIFYAKKPGTILLEMKGSNGCTYLDSTVMQFKEPIFSIPNDTSVCDDNYADFTSTTSSRGIFDWYFGGTETHNSKHVFLDRNNVTVLVDEPQQVLVRFTDTVGLKSCTFSNSFTIGLHPIPSIGLQYPDTICNGDSFEVKTRLKGGIWGFQGVSQNGKSAWLRTQTSEPGGRPYALTAKGISQYQCTKDTQVLIFVNSVPKVKFTAQDSIFKNWKLSPQNLSTNARYLRYNWEVGNPAFVTSNAFSPTLRIDSIGTFELKLQIEHKWNHCADSTSQSIKVLRKVGMDNPVSSKLNIYPNPAHKALNIEWSAAENFSVIVYNISGQAVTSKRVLGKTHQLNVADLPEGFYFLRLQNDGQLEIRTFEIIR